MRIGLKFIQKLISRITIFQIIFKGPGRRSIDYSTANTIKLALCSLVSECPYFGSISRDTNNIACILELQYSNSDDATPQTQRQASSCCICKQY